MKQVYEQTSDPAIKEPAFAILSEWGLTQEIGASTQFGTVYVKLSSQYFNSAERNAEYILIPGPENTEVDDVWFARYPVTNRLYERFILFLQTGELSYPGHGSRVEFADYLMRKEHAGENLTHLQSWLMSKEIEKWSAELVSRLQGDMRVGGSDQPVVGCKWYGAVAYCEWLTWLRQDGECVYRLPTEAEWQWAASGGVREYPWGDETPDDARANFDRNVGATTSVGSYPAGATPEGLMDMAGNVWEWSADWYDADKHGRALRGGSWLISAANLRCSARISDLHPNYVWVNDGGFRVVRARSRI